MKSLTFMLIAALFTWNAGCGDGPRCGDGVLGGVEQCDDGNLENNDGCSAICAIEVEVCTDGADNNGDGAIDCGDAQCAAHPACEAICTAPLAVDDPATVMADTTGSNDFSLSSCQMMFNGFDGPDMVYAVTPQNPILEIRLQSGADQGVAIRTVCDDPQSEIACADFFFGGTDETITTRVTPGEPLFVIVGAFQAGTEGPFVLDIASRPVVCGDGVIDRPEEQCDDANQDLGDGCDDSCQFELVCGDGHLANLDFGGNEACDDGNTTAGDGCDDACQVESVLEIEPNEDGTPEPGGMDAEGNDFAAAGAQGPFTEDVTLEGAISPAGDEDIFAIQNPGLYQESVRFDMFKKGRGLGQSCADALDTVLTIRDDVGFLIDQNDDRDSATDLCSGLDFVINPGETVFAHIIYYGDNTESDSYFLTVNFATCGDGILEGLEECDDGNHDNGDGCDQDCAVE